VRASRTERLSPTRFAFWIASDRFHVGPPHTLKEHATIMVGETVTHFSLFVARNPCRGGAKMTKAAGGQPANSDPGRGFGSRSTARRRTPALGRAGVDRRMVRCWGLGALHPASLFNSAEPTVFLPRFAFLARIHALLRQPQLRCVFRLGYPSACGDTLGRDWGAEV
jgi:hypothetical protein